MTKYIIVFLGNVFLATLSQALLKSSALKQYDTKIKEYLNIKVAAAYAIFFLSTIVTVWAYRVVPLSLGTILESTSYIYSLLLGWFIFKDKVTLRKIAGITLIIIGVLFVA